MRTITECRSCKSGNLVEVLDLGEQYLSDFRADLSKPPLYPLVLLMCLECTLVQLLDTTPSADMYHDRYGFKSGVNEAIRADLADIVAYAHRAAPNAESWLDIACNDGTLLSFVPENITRVGIDPITKLAVESREHADLIISDFFKPEYFSDRATFDVITSISMFYDLDDPNEFVSGVKSVLVEDGVWVIQQNYLLTTLELSAVDNICHEHLEYYSLHSLQPLLARHGLEINDVVLSDVNGGCVRTLVSRIGTHPVQSSVAFRMGNERRAGIATVEAHWDFAEKVTENMQEVRDFVKEANAEGKTVFIYGASTRGGTIWQAAGLDVTDLPYAVERNPEKFGKYISSIGVPIISEEEARAMKPDYMLVSPWFFRDVFVEREKEYLKEGGALVFPLPTFEVVTHNGN